MYKKVCPIAYLWGEIVICHYEDRVDPCETCKTEKCLYFGPNILKHWKYMDIFTQSPIGMTYSRSYVCEVL